MPDESVTTALELRAVSFARDSARVGPVDVVIPARQFTVFRGDTDSGKDRLLRILGLLERPDQGDVLVAGQSTNGLDEPALAELRRNHFGYLFAAPFLLPAFTVIENVVMPIFKLLDSDPTEARLRAEELLQFVGVSQYEQDRASDVPLFEQRCIALARALATQPRVLLVEELDSELQAEQQRHFSRLLREVCLRWHTTVVATASPAWGAAAGDHVFEIGKGRIQPAPVSLSSS
ncbi:ATP-binding cassette domain-containing protein [Verrucomicrobiota bacterium sgz303538]